MTTPGGPYAAPGNVRVYPATNASGAGLVWAHGGAFTGGDLDMPESDAVARALAARGTTVVAVDYRLAGEGTRFPAPLDDVVAAFRWVSQNAAALGIRPDRLALGGASAGGNLAAGTALRLALDGETDLPALVVLAYPTLLAVQPAPGPDLRRALDAAPLADVFGPAVVRRMYEDYLGTEVDGAPLAAVPGLATVTDVRGYPPTLIVNGDVDELRVSAEIFARTLAQAERPVTSVVELGTVHGHLNRPDEPAFAASIHRIAAALAALPAFD